MRSLVPVASMLFALAAALPAAAQREEQFRAWCHYTTGPRATNQQTIEGCSALIAAGREPAGKLYEAYVNRGSAYATTGDHKRAIDDYGEALKLEPGEAVLWTPAAIPARSSATCRQPLPTATKGCGSGP